MTFVSPVEKVKLKDGVLSQLEAREWHLPEIREGIALLTHPKVKYTLGVKEDNIEWNGIGDRKKVIPCFLPFMRLYSYREYDHSDPGK